MTEPETVPTVGSRIGRYLIIREVAQGPLGPLFIAEREVGEGVSYGLARVVNLPSELPAHDEQALADAIWDSTHVNHELVLRVADVITGKGWITLIHEHSEGSLLTYLQTCASKVHGAFPAKVASRMALDVIEGLEQSRDLCTSAGIPWRPGSVSPSSLLLGPDGRVRAMDGQITAVALRAPTLRRGPGVASHAAPELLDETREPSERSDVFAVGVLLWELLTGQSLFVEHGSSTALGHGFKVPKVAQAVPSGTKVPQGLVHTVHTALEADPSKRQQSLRELAVAIVMGVEDVSTYEQVLEFTDGLLLATASDAPAAAAAPETPTPATPNGPVAEPVVFTVETPGVADAVAAPVEVAPAPPVETQASATEPGVDRADAASVDGGPRPNPDDGQDEVTGERTAPTVTDEPAPSVEKKASADEPAPSVEKKASPEANNGGFRAPLGTLPGHGDGESKASRSAPSAAGLTRPNVAPSEPAPVASGQSSNKAATTDSPAPTSVPPTSAGPFRLVHDEPFVPIAAKPVQSVGGTERNATPAQSPSSKPPPSASPSIQAPAVIAPEAPTPSIAPRHTVQLSMGTIVFGILTTVLAVVVVMMVIMRPSGNAADASTASAKANPATQRAEPVSSVALGDSPVANPASIPAAPVGDAGLAAAASAKGDHHKHAPGGSVKDKSGKPAGVESDTRNADSKSEQPTNRHFIPNEL